MVWWSCAGIAKMHEKGSNNLPARKHLTKIDSSNEFREYINNSYINSKFNLDPKSGMGAVGQAFTRYYEIKPYSRNDFCNGL